jgi:hypothetical protein
MNEQERQERNYLDIPVGWIILWLLFALSIFVPPAKAQPSPQTSARATVSFGPRVPSLNVEGSSAASVERVEAVGMTVSDMDR